MIYLTQAFNISEKIRFRIGKLARKIPAAVELFHGEGWPVEVEDDEETVPEEQKMRFEIYRNLIRVESKYIEAIMQNPTGDIPYDAVFDLKGRDEFIE